MNRKINVSVFGTKIASDAIGFRNNEFNLKSRIVELSPFSVSDNMIAMNVEKLMADIEETNDYFRQLFIFDFEKNFEKVFQSDGSDIMVFDLMSARQTIWEVTFADETRFRLTWNQCVKNNLEKIKSYIEKSLNTKIVSEKLIYPLLLTEKELEKEIERFVDCIKKIQSKKQIVYLKSRNIYKGFQKNGRFYVIPKVELVNKYNDFYELCSSVLYSKCQIPVIEELDNLFGYEACKPLDIFNFEPCYYDYIKECIKSIHIKKYADEKNELLERYNGRLNLSLEELKLNSLIDAVYRQRKGRKIVLLGESEVCRYLLKKKYGLQVERCIPYDREIKREKIESALSQIKGLNEQYMIVIPRLSRDNDVLRLLWQYGYGFMIGYYCVTPPPINLNDFIGAYDDFYDNHIEVNTKVNISISGSGSSIYVGVGEMNPEGHIQIMSQCCVKIADGFKVNDDRIVIRAYDGSNVQIAENTKWGKNTHIRASFYTDTYIGANCKIEDETIIFNGDGHAIFDLSTGENINYNLNNTPPEKHKICIEDNVFIGEHAFILSGSKILNHTYVEAESMVNKVFSNPGRVLKGNPAREEQ